MSVANAVRRLGARVAGLLGAAVICAACSSTTGGTPESPGPGSASAPLVSSSVGVGSRPSSTGLTVPSLSGVPSIGGAESGTPFCKDFSNFNPSDVTGDPSAALRLYDKLAADAPAAIKPDVETIRNFLNSALNGNPDTSGTQDFQQAITHLTQYYAGHCVSS